MADAAACILSCVQVREQLEKEDGIKVDWPHEEE